MRKQGVSLMDLFMVFGIETNTIIFTNDVFFLPVRGVLKTFRAILRENVF
jgi:hypothetical protein